MRPREPWQVFAGSALFSPCGRYRYRLDRHFEQPLGDQRITWIMLNPSTADAEVNDPTVARVVKRSHALGAERVTVVNLYAYRSTDPRALRTVADPVGPDNDDEIHKAALDSDLVIAGWGANADPARVDRLSGSLNGHGVPIYCLAETRNGQPRHPLYVPYVSGPYLWRIA